MGKNLGSNKKVKATLSLDEVTMNTLKQIGETSGYGSVSASIRVMVRKYAKYELDPIGTREQKTTE